MSIYNSKIPIVSAIGHETDYTISDFVSDYRAPTPSAAAEIVFPNLEEIILNVETCYKSLYNIAQRKITNSNNKLEYLLNHSVFKHKTKFYSQKTQEIDILIDNLQKITKNTLLKKEEILDLQLKQLEKLSPTSTMLRGFSMVTTNSNKVVKSTKNINIGDNLNIRVTDGIIQATIVNKESF